MGSVTVAGWIAWLVLGALLITGWSSGELRPRATTVFLLCACLIWLVLPRVLSSGALFVTPGLAVLDIVLMLFVVKGDVRLS